MPYRPVDEKGMNANTSSVAFMCLFLRNDSFESYCRHLPKLVLGHGPLGLEDSTSNDKVRDTNRFW